VQSKRHDEVLNILDDSAVLQAAFYYWTKYAGNVVSHHTLRLQFDFAETALLQVGRELALR